MSFNILGSISLIMTGISAPRGSGSQVKQLNTMLVDIGKASTYSATQLKTLWNTAHTTSDKYGKKVGDYLADFTEISQYGYHDTEVLHVQLVCLTKIWLSFH